MRTPGLAAITMAFAIAACSDVAEPTAMISDPSTPEAVAHKSFSESQRSSGHRLGDQKDKCDANDHDRRWGRRGYHSRFRQWGSRHDRRSWHFRGHDSDDCETPAPATGTISGTVMNDGEPAAGYAVFLLNADGSVAANALTDATGAYSLVGAAGDYLVCEENPFTEAHGFLGQTRPQTGGACPGAAYAPLGFSLTLAGGATLTGNNFSNMRLD